MFYRQTRKPYPLTCRIAVLVFCMLRYGAGASTSAPSSAGPPDVRLELSISVSECYVGQPFVVRGAWHSALPFHRFRAVQIDVPLFHNAAFRVAAAEPVPDDASGKRLGVPVSNARIIADRARSVIDGKQVETLRFERVAVPLQPGTFTVAPSTLRCVAIPPSRSRPRTVPSYFNNNFFEQPETDQVTPHVAESAALTLTVEPLPETGRPADFSGQVGACVVGATAAPGAVNVGDPIALSVTVSGCTFPETMQVPALDSQPAFARSFGLPAKSSRRRVVGGNAVFVVALRPLRADVTEIPPVRIPYFDPVAKRYDVAQSMPIPIIVSEAATTTAFDAHLSGGAQLRNPLVANRDGIRHNVNAAAAVALHPRSPVLFFGGLIGIPPLCFLLFVVVTARRRLARRDPAAARARMALGRFRRQSKPLLRAGTSDPDASRRLLDSAVRAYFAARLDLTPQATCDEVLARLRCRGDCDEADFAVLQGIYGACDQQRFAKEPAAVDFRALAVQAAAVVRRIDRRTRRMPRSVLVPLLLGVLGAGAVRAETQPPESLVICREANRLFASANQAALSDPDRARTLYQRAALRYRFLIAERGLDTAPLHGNLANAYFFSGDMGQAIVHYHRALRCDPQDVDVRRNLRYVGGLCIDEPPRGRLQAVLGAVTIWHRWPLGLRTGLFCVLHTAVWVLAASLLYRRTRYRSFGLYVSAALAVVLLGSIATTVFGWLEPVDGVIVAKEVTARHGDGYIYESAFSSPLHAGTEFALIERRERWFRIALPGGSACWIPAHSAALIE